MRSVFKWSKPATDLPHESNAPDHGACPDPRAALQTISARAATMGRNAAEVSGLITDTHAVSERQAVDIVALAGQLGEITRAQEAIGHVTAESLEAVDRARTAVEQVAAGVAGIVATLQQVSQAAGTITQIALQTRLVAFNASVEAKRAGDAGRGFGVVADAIKELSAQVEASSKDIKGTVGELGQRIDALSREIDSQPQAGAGSGAPSGAFHRALADVQAGVGSITTAAEQSRGICDGLNAQMSRIEGEMHETGRALDTAMARSEALLQLSEQLIELMSDCGIETEDTPYIDAARDAAGRVSALLERALAQGEIDVETLFDERYEPIASTNPPQFMARFGALAERLFPPVQEALLTLSPKVVFCITVDRNGYVPVHNLRYSQPQRGDLAWDTANSRYRRIFDDRTGLAAARNQRPFLLQTYRRHMGDDHYVLMKDASAPVWVAGRHWGGVRVAYEF